MSWILDMVLPSQCPICRRHGPAPCDACARRLVPAPLLVTPVGLTACWAALRYDDDGQKLITSLKYRNGRAALGWLANQMSTATIDHRVDVVTWAPTTRAHRRHRGYDQAELLARHIAREARLPVASTLFRLPGPSQTGRSLAERLAGPAFDVRRGSHRTCDNRRVAIVDDVVTSGATMSAAAGALGSTDATAIIGLAAARTPEPRSR